MIKTTWLKLALLMTIFSFSAFAQTESTSYDFAPVKYILDGYVQDKKLAGSVVLIQQDGETIFHYASGYQDLEAKKLMANDSLFRIASMTKAITSVAIIRLQEQGKLSVMDPVSKFIPAFKHTTVAEVQADGSTKIVPAKREITIHDLLTHTSGISYTDDSQIAKWQALGFHQWYFPHRKVDMLEALSSIADIPHKAQPGDAFVYGYSTDILGVIVEIASGMSLEQYFQQIFFKPLNMDDTHFYLPADKVERLATVYSASSTGIKRAPEASDTDELFLSQGHYVNGPRKIFSGGAGLVSTANDYSQFLQMLLNNGVANGQRILSETSVSTLLQNQIPYVDFPWGESFGYSFVVERAKHGQNLGQVTKFAGGGAYHTSYIVRPKERLTIVYLTQLIPANDLKDFQSVESAIEVALGIGQ